MASPWTGDKEPKSLIFLYSGKVCKGVGQIQNVQKHVDSVFGGRGSWVCSISSHSTSKWMQVCAPSWSAGDQGSAFSLLQNW